MTTILIEKTSCCRCATGAARDRRVSTGRRTTRAGAPDAVYELRLDLWATANVFLPGHRIRLEISSSNFPRFGRNSNTGGEIASEAAGEYRPAINRIFHDASHASRLILPIIER